MATETLIAETTIVATLKGDATLTALLATGPDGTPAVYTGHAPEGSNSPYVIVAQFSGADQQPLMTLRAQSRFRYRISAVDATQSIVGLDAILERVDALLNNLTTATGGSDVGFLRYQPPQPEDDPDLGREYRKLIAAYWVYVTH